MQTTEYFIVLTANNCEYAIMASPLLSTKREAQQYLSNAYANQKEIIKDCDGAIDCKSKTRDDFSIVCSDGDTFWGMVHSVKQD